MKLAAILDAGAPVTDELARVRELEGAGLQMVLVPESYGYDAISTAGYIAAATTNLEVGTGIVNVFSRSPALLAMSAATIDALSGGRFVLGLGASGAQVIEGFHGIPYKRPLARLKECTDVCRMAWARDALEYEGRAITLPLAGEAAARRPIKLINRPVRPNIPIWWASVTWRSVEAAAEYADGWMPPFFLPERANAVWGGALRAGAEKRHDDRGPLEIVAGGMVAVDDHLIGARRQEVLDLARPRTALYMGGMGSAERNFYNELCQQYGFAEAAAEVLGHFKAGDRQAAERSVPQEVLESSNLIGSSGLVRERIAAYRAAGVTTLLVEPIGDNRARTVSAMRTLLEDLD
ncbi:MAG TPA: LLM class F420-dependent oxidoreductase [Acidimicrobiales bacterium]|nr:LLM class F420-dependent oxidoreductase [Acidimicrobiales bacterium]